ncbi:hypothetical protein HPB49_008269 [Dermacentor silvarum]|uniref:Uncharacterized protein n=1 Tax=Dermacentor silvarum TaxID=543639 RepID=A0ACB8DNQ5_DERSI|nr:hypothetical protein HPB49_008269 [Dermacentor silvarum]
MRYLSEEELKGFENYEYTCKDTSPLSNYVMHPFWDQAVKLVPRGVAPNVLTLSGFVLTLVNVGLLSYYDFAFFASSDLHPEAPPVPPWVWLVCAVNQFLAHTLDGIDGKHARRTGSSGPLGELFDHGLDSWATLFMPVCLYSVFGRAEMSCNTWRFLLVLCNIHFCFILSHWEKYNTGILYLPWGYDISQMPSVWEAVRPLLSGVVLFVLALSWAVASPNDVLSHQPRLFYFLLGTLFSNISCRLIISQMTSTRCEALNLLLLPVALGVAGCLWFQADETLVLCLLATLVALAHVHYGVCVVQQMCHHFHIHCFSLKRPPVE